MRALFGALLIFGAAARSAALAPDNSSWPQAHGNQQHTSTSAAAGFSLPKISWVHSNPSATNSRKNMSVSIGSNGTIYVGGRSIFEALNPDGTVKFTANEVTASPFSWGQPAVADNGQVYISSPAAVYAYSAAGSGAVTFVSSAPAGNVAANPGGGGAITISNTGRIYAAHGDETFNPAGAPLNQPMFNIYSFDGALANPVFKNFGGSSGYGRSGIALSTDSAKAYTSAYLSNVLAMTSAGVGSAFNLSDTATLWGVQQIPGLAVRNDGSILASVLSDSTHCNALAPANHLEAYSAAGTLLWSNCSFPVQSPSAGFSNDFQTPVSSTPATTYVVSEGTVPVIYAIENTGGNVVWSYDIRSFAGFTPSNQDLIGPPTLAGGTTLYFTYCVTPTTRLVGLNANTGLANFDVMISSTNCFLGQPAPAPGGRIYVYNGPDVIALEESNAAGISMSNSAPSTVGDFWYSTVTAAITLPGAVPISSGVPVEVTSFQTSGAVSFPSITPSATGFALTDTSGNANFPVQWKLPSGLSVGLLPGLVSTITFRSPGLPTQTVFLRETRPATVTVSSTPAAQQGTQHVSTITFTVLNGGGAPVPNVPCKLTLAPPGSVAMTYTPDLTSVGFVASNGSGQASIVASDNLAALPKASYATYGAVIQAGCLDQPLQSITLNENRVASVSVSTGLASMEIGSSFVRVSTLTITLKDASGAVLPSVPVALDVSASPAPVTISPFAAAFTTATDPSGQARFFVHEDLSNVDPSNYAGMVSTLTLHVLGFPDQTISLSESRIGSVSVATGTAAMVGGFRVVTATVTVRDSTGALMPLIPVGLKAANYGLVTTFAPSFFTNTVGKAATNGLGVATFTITEDVLSNTFVTNYDFTNYAVFNASTVVSAPARADQTVGISENRVASYAISVSSAILQPDIQYTTITVTVRDASLSPLAGIPVAVSSYTRAGATAFERLLMNNAVGPNSNYASATTNAAGQATFTLYTTGFDTFDNYNDFIASIAVVPLNLAVSTTPFLVESNFLDHYQIAAPTGTSVGQPFGSTVTAMNFYSHRLSSYTESGVTLTPLFTGTNVQGSGSLGTSVVNFTGTAGTVAIGAETYNKIENIQIKATRGSGVVKTGLSNTIVVIGPDHFLVSVPTSAAAGAVFGATITAVDVGNNPVIGYGATLSLTPVVALATGTPSSGSLTPAAVNLPANGTVFISNLSYNKGDSIQIKVADSGLGIASFSSSMTITQPPLTIDHYHITMATSITVGSPFRFDVEPQNASSAPVSYSLARTLNVQAVLAGTNIAGSGSLGVTTLPLASGATYSFTASQTYNKIESVQLKVTDDDGRVGITSYTVTFTGPTQFVVAVATSAQAGVPFQFVVQAQDAGNNQVLGYSGTVNISAVDSVNTALSGGGTLGVTSLNLSGGAGSSSFQSYTKAQGIRFRVTDSGIGVTTVSSSMTIVAGPAASLTLSGNPQSTVATVPSILTAQAADAFNNPIMGSTVTFTVASGSAVVTLGLVGGAVPGSAGVVSTQAPTNVSGAASAFFGSTTTLFSQGDLVVATLGSLTATTTIYNAVLLTGAGGVVANQSNPLLSVNCPAATWAFNVRMSVAGKSELSAADLALTTRAFAASPNTFVSTTVMKVDVVRDASPSTLAGAGGKLVSIGLPFTASGGNTTVGSILVPQSVLRVFKLNKQTSVFEMVLDGVNLPQSNGTVQAQVADPEGIFALGAPPFVTLGGASSGTVTAALGSGAQAVVTVPFGSFTTATTLTVSPLSAGSIPALPSGLNLTPTGIAISVNTNGIEPVSPVGISLGYTAAAVGGLNANQFRIARYDAGVGWKVLDSQVDTTGKTVVAQTDGFSIFEIVAAAPSSSVSSGFVFPNPFRPSLGHTNLKFSGLPASAHIKVFTVSGRLLKELDADSTGSVLSWNGTDKDGRPLASGVYLAVVEDTTGGSGKATIKFAVQR